MTGDGQATSKSGSRRSLRVLLHLVLKYYYFELLQGLVQATAVQCRQQFSLLLGNSQDNVSREFGWHLVGNCRFMVEG